MPEGVTRFALPYLVLSDFLEQKGLEELCVKSPILFAKLRSDYEV
jgi:hypothetical protein